MKFDDYALHLARRLTSPNTVKLRRDYIAKLEAFADRDATRATENDLYEFLEAHPHWSTATKRTVVCAFRDYYRWAVKSGLVDVDRSEDMATPRAHRLPSRIASEECIREGLEKGTRTTERRCCSLQNAVFA